MTSRERICSILNFRRPDRIGIYDTYLDDTIDAWKANGLPLDVSPQDYFDLDLDIFDLKDISSSRDRHLRTDRFTVISFSVSVQT